MRPDGLIVTNFSSPIGEVGVGVTEEGLLRSVRLPCHDPLVGPRSDDLTDPVVEQFEEYFSGQRHSFDLATEAPGSPWQLAVWQGLREIPYAATCSYADLAADIGRPGAARAVGSANRANRLPIVVPCHRVIAADGSIGGYAGFKGLDIKRALLALEQAFCGSAPRK